MERILISAEGPLFNRQAKGSMADEIFKMTLLLLKLLFPTVFYHYADHKKITR